MTDEQPQRVKKVTIAHDERGWHVQAEWGPRFGYSSRPVPTFKTLGDALDHIKKTLPLDE